MKYLEPTYFIDYEADAIQEIIKPFKTNELSDKEKAIQVYLKIRDGWLYDGYQISVTAEGYKASNVTHRKRGHCIDKSILLIACLRGLNIPSRLHLAKIKNHIGIEKLIEKMGTAELVPHGFVGIFINNKWVKASPAFNATLCDYYKVAPLDFDGENDSIFQQYNQNGNQFMEYLDDYGHFDDLPLDFIKTLWRKHYPNLSRKLSDDGKSYKVV